MTATSPGFRTGPPGWPGRFQGRVSQPVMELRPPSRAHLLCWALAALAAACGSGGGGGGLPQGEVGSEVAKPGGGTFFLDEHHLGRATRLHLDEVVWGRLVDLHQL